MHVRRQKDSYSLNAPTDYDDCLRKGEDVFERAPKATSTIMIPYQRQSFSAEASELRWFLLPSEVKYLFDGLTLPKVETPFTPRQYASDTQEYGLQHYSTIPTRKDWPIVSMEESKSEQENSVAEKDDDVDLVQCNDNRDYLNDAGNFLGNVLFVSDDDEESGMLAIKSLRRNDPGAPLWMPPTRNIMKPTSEALLRYKMIKMVIAYSYAFQAAKTR